MSESTSFTEALRAKYCCDEDEENTGYDFVQITVFGNAGQRRRARGDGTGDNADRAVGLSSGHGDKIPELGYLKNVVLYKSQISHAAIPPAGLSSLCPNVTDLDLSSNILNNWSEVLSIVGQLPLLKFVNLSSNPLSNLEIDSSEIISSKIEDLVLNDTKVSWREVATLSRLLPNLKQLHLCMNDYEEISVSAEDLSSCLGQLCKLTLNNNNFKRWEEVSKLRFLPLLETLVLLENPLENVFYNESQEETFDNGSSLNGLGEVTKFSSQDAKAEPGSTNTQIVDCRGAGFNALESLCISDTALSDWRDLDELRCFPNLKSVKIKNIPLLERWSEADRRKVAIACLPTIASLNSSEITPEEREKSERQFVRLFMDHSSPPLRHSELVEKYGKLQPIHQIDLSRGFQEFTRLNFIYRGQCVKQDVIRIVEPVGQLKKYCGKLVDKHPSLVKLYHKTQDPDTNEIVMEELFLESLPMSRFDLKEGDEIHIDIKMMNPGQPVRWQPALRLAP